MHVLEEIREKNAILSDVGQFMKIKLILVSGAVNSLRFADRICIVSFPGVMAEWWCLILFTFWTLFF